MYIENNDILTFLGYKNQKLDDSILNMINSCKEEAINLINERFIYGVYDIEEDKDIRLLNTNIVLSGESITRHLKDCNKVILFACTLGIDIERKIRLYEKIDLTKSIILDACASILVESLCDDIEKIIKKGLNKEYRYTLRFSPGYGDLDISSQKKVIGLLDANRKIGLTCSSNFILMPRKSVTAIIGISNNDIKSEYDICDSCHARENCMYRNNNNKCANYNK
ncbi:vitamin B12 dependent-methionine synthase activation domain-containing protein [Romboutsia sp. 1001713B170207_170306_H8]|uniref:vitamin B12 dependent-methionine synthase activation domain-containing protein n=1 Tax=Romboutsia sp. 1001713B170207_170306_H8 TaxID=2787112 RepID=UPI001899773C|nr:vitamin B12 dependent-methionine synthase activation domain-containing protein [Romboutsia sp. 1001713B170207_170306_H8]